ncbi:MAG: HAMP domain-containing histidine kinase [Coriobacteriia bacterium]|nr:HAMP domain-containing histidine kinase [Coriobacteriia bacterium]
MARRTIGFRLGLAFAVVAAFTAVLAAAIVAVSWQRSFDSYIRERLQERADATASVIANQYLLSGDWTHVGIPESLYYLLADLNVQVFDTEGKLVGYVQKPGADAPEEVPPISAGDVSATAPIVIDGEEVGEVQVASTSANGLLTERDLRFRSATFRGLGLAALLAVFAASIAGAVYARSIVRPINAVTRVAARLRQGETEARTGMEGTDAISQLGSTLDSMADSVNAERTFERQLTADVAHELRTPLQAIQATVEAMQDGVMPVDEERLGVLHNETVRLGRLTGSILELSRLETGIAHFEMKPIDLAEPVEQAVEGSRALMESIGLTFEAAIERGPVIMGDRDRLTQAVGNLLSNAARYTPEGGHVRVEVRAEGSDAVLVVSDTGIGMGTEENERAFTRFWRADRARTRASGGLGIGLAVVKEIVDRHSGQVDIVSAEGEGTTVRILIPLADDRPRVVV